MTYVYCINCNFVFASGPDINHDCNKEALMNVYPCQTCSLPVYDGQSCNHGVDFVHDTGAFVALETTADVNREGASSFLNDQPLASAAEERQIARNWIETAAQYARNADYYKDERDRLYREGMVVSPILADKWGREAAILGALGEDINCNDPPQVQAAIERLASTTKDENFRQMADALKELTEALD